MTMPAGARDLSIGYEIDRRTSAGSGWNRYEVISERRIAGFAHREGFAEIEDIRLSRDRYIVDATRPNGAVFRMAFDAYDGTLLSRERRGWSRGDDGRSGRGNEFRFDLRG
jgi:uncharacterized membrane protein YkoI